MNHLQIKDNFNESSKKCKNNMAFCNIENSYTFETKHYELSMLCIKLFRLYYLLINY